MMIVIMTVINGDDNDSNDSHVQVARPRIFMAAVDCPVHSYHGHHMGAVRMMMMMIMMMMMMMMMMTAGGHAQTGGCGGCGG